MAVEIKFEGLGDDLLNSIKQIRDQTSGLVTEVEKANNAYKKGADENVKATEKLNDAVGVTAKLVTDLGGKAKSGGVSSLAADADKAKTNINSMATALGKATIASQTLRDYQRQIVADMKRVNDAADKGLITQDQQVEALEGLAEEYGAVATQLTDVDKLVKGLTKELDDQPDKVTALRTQFTQAKNNVAEMIAQFGEFSPEAIKATQEAARLGKELGTINQRVKALEPGAGFRAFGQVAQGIAGGFTAATGALALFGAESDNLQKGLVKIQAALAITQGLNAFFTSFEDGLKNVKILLAATTTAQKAATVATEADIAAKGAQTAATVSGTTATTGLIGALNALKVAALSNPFTAILVAAAVLIGLFISLSDSTKDFAEEITDLEKRMRKLSDAATGKIDFATRLRELDSENKLIEQGGTLQAQREKLERDVEIQRSAIAQKRMVAEAQLMAFQAQAQQVAIELAKAWMSGDEDRIATARKNSQALSANIQAQKNIIEKGEEDLAAIRVKSYGDTLALNKKFADEAKANAEERVKIRRQMGEELVALQRQLSERLREAELQAADPRQRLELERQAAQEEIDEMRQNLLRKIAMIELEKTMTVEAINNLSQAEKDARADALIQEKGIELPKDQQEEVNKLKILAQQEYSRKSIELLREETETKLQLITDGTERERSAFELDLQSRMEALKKAGASSQQVLDFQAAQQDEYAQKARLKELDLQEQIALARIEGQERGAVSEREFTRRIEEQKLIAQEIFAKARLEAIEKDGSLEAEAQRAILEKTLSDIEKAKAKLAEQVPEISIYKLLGINFKDDKEKQEFEQAVASLVSTISGAVNDIYDAQIKQVDQQIDATDQLIADSERRTNELNAQLQREIQDQRDGYASNVDAVKQALAMEKVEQEKALAERKKLIAERQKLARQQAIIDSIVQASSLITAAAQSIAYGAGKGGPVGAIIAIAAMAGVLASFFALKAKVKAASSGESFRYGGQVNDPFIMSGPSHAQGGLGIYNEKTGERIAEAEGNEAMFIVRKENAKHLPMLEAINEGDMARTARLAIAELTGAHGITLEPETVNKMVVMKEQYQTVIHDNTNKNLERDMREIKEEVRGLREDQGGKAHVENGPKGRRVVVKHTERVTR